MAHQFLVGVTQQGNQNGLFPNPAIIKAYVSSHENHRVRMNELDIRGFERAGQRIAAVSEPATRGRTFRTTIAANECARRADESIAVILPPQRGAVAVILANCDVSVYCCQRVTLPPPKSQT